MKPYNLMCSLFGHTGDVKSVAETKDNGFVSVSRDLTAKLWAYQNLEGSNGYANVKTVNAHKKYVNSVVVVYSLKEYPNGLIITGSNDQTISIYDIHSEKVIAQIEAHESAVCSLYFNENSNNNLLYSGSFDNTAKVWNLNNLSKNENHLKASVTLSGHDRTVWAVLAIENQNIILTGSADKSIKQWQLNAAITNAEYVCKYTGHIDCVRGLVSSSINSQEFFSCSNDGRVIQWRLNNPNPIRIFKITDSFLYSINMIKVNGQNSNECLFITTGEDRTLRIHSASKIESESDTSGCIQKITLPCQTLWNAICLRNGNIVVACSDGSIRIFTQSEDLIASAAELKEYETELAQFSIPVKADETISQINRSELPGIEALSIPGKKDGQVLMINNDNQIEVFQWSESETRWIKIGVAVGSGDSAGANPKATYLGKEYDYVFDIELDDAPNIKLKLPYNLSEDPYFAAQNFIEKNQLSQLFLDQVAQFIIKNTQSENMSTNSEYFDPFTGENRYVPQEHTNSSAGSSSNLVDPFTGSNAYHARNNERFSQSSKKSQEIEPPKKIQNISNEYFPHLTFILFDQLNYEPIIKKLKEFQLKNANEIKDDLIADQSGIELIENLLINHSKLKTTDEFKDEIDLLFQMINLWPKDTLFPLIDATRILLLNTNISRYLTRNYNQNDDVGKQSNNLYSLIKLVNHDSIINSMLVIKILCNVFKPLDDVKSVSTQHLLAFIIYERNHIINTLSSLLSSNNKSFQVAYSSLLLNYVVLLEKLYGSNEKYSTPFLNEIAKEFVEFFNSSIMCENIRNWDSESIFRILVAIGTLLSKTNSLKETEYLIILFKSFENFKNVCVSIDSISEKYPEKVSKSAKYLLKILL